MGATTKPASSGLPASAIERHPDLLGYRDSGFGLVSGWCQPPTLPILAELSELQDEVGVAGGSAEIGVYHGKLLIALHMLRSPGSRTLAIDVFEHQELNVDGSGLGDLDQFRTNLEAYGPDPDAVDVMTRDSLDLADDDVAAILERYGRFRWFSVDGGHTVDHAVNDLRLAERLTAAGGIVVLDDYYNPDWPGVHEGFARRYILDNPRIVPFLYGFGKLYLTTIGHHDPYFGGSGERLPKLGHKVKLIQMYGHYVLSLRAAS